MASSDDRWYEAYADEVHRLGKEWPELLTDEEEARCETAADRAAPRPLHERSEH